MCYLHWTPDDEEFDFSNPGPRPFPRLTWAVPVDAAELGASIKAYAEQLPQINALQLCHRFGGQQLSVLPQEILDHIVKMLYQSGRQASMQEWVSKFACFQGRCTRMQHLEFDDSHIEELWNMFFNNTQGFCARHKQEQDLDPDDYDIEEKREMVCDYIDDDGDIMFDEVWEAHDTTRDQWLDMLCLCKDSPSQDVDSRTFTHLQKARHASLFPSYRTDGRA